MGVADWGDPLAEFWASPAEEAIGIPLAEPMRRAVLGGRIVSISHAWRLALLTPSPLAAVVFRAEHGATLPWRTAIPDCVAQPAKVAEEVVGLCKVDERR